MKNIDIKMGLIVIAVILLILLMLVWNMRMVKDDIVELRAELKLVSDTNEFYNCGGIDKRITYYAEFLEPTFGTMNLSVLIINPNKIERLKGKLERVIGKKYIEYITISNRQMRVRVWVSDKNAIEILRVLKDKLMENGFKYE